MSFLGFRGGVGFGELFWLKLKEDVEAMEDASSVKVVRVLLRLDSLGLLLLFGFGCDDGCCLPKREFFLR